MPYRVGSQVVTQWGSEVRIVSRHNIDGRWYCCYEYGLGGCSEGAAWEDTLQLPVKVAHKSVPESVPP